MGRGRRVLVGLVAANVLLLVLGLGRGKPLPSDKRIKVGLVFDVGGVGDKSFNDAANAGLVRAQNELDISVRYIEPADGTDRESALRELAAADYDLVIGVGFIFSEDMRQLARRFPRVKFACIDYAGSPEETPPNLVGLAFREHEGSFLIGALAGLSTKSKKLGFVGGMQIPLIRKFEAGYAAGVKHVCPECEVFSAYAGTEPKAFADPTTGKELALSQYGRGADIIFHAAGKTGIGVFVAARDRGKYAIGVDADQRHEASCCVMTSMVKGVEVAVFGTIVEVVEGKWRGGVHELGLKEGGMDYVWDDLTLKVAGEAVHRRVEEIRQSIISGEIVVPFE
jgi:basic membrane protein A and related proteins